MQYKKLTSGIVLTISILPATVLGKSNPDPCKPSAESGTVCALPVAEIRPTQFAVGSVAVDCKKEKISGKSKKKLKKYLAEEKRRIPAIVGPDGNFYMTDHHHLATALYRADSPDWGDKSKVLHIEIDTLDDFTPKGASKSEFWEAMQKANSSYNYDNKGVADMNFDLLPTDVGGLLNDPYRTLSRWVRESCGYVKLGKEQCEKIRTDHDHEAPFFMEFYWGEFFRQKLPLTVKELKVCQSIPYSQTCLDDEITQLKAIYEQALKLAASEEAKAYLEEQGLDPWQYGFNPSGDTVKLDWSGDQDQCDEVPDS